MTTPINLNKARKTRARIAKAQRAAENRAKFGAPKSERVTRESIQAKADETLDGKKRER
ncbi:MAG: DUF4169 family protein [Pseudomonadota bacterium]